MITLAITLKEGKKAVEGTGAVVSMGDPTPAELDLARGLLEAVEKYFTKERAVDGSVFVRTALPKK
jgi:hypothetical protein